MPENKLIKDTQNELSANNNHYLKKELYSLLINDESIFNFIQDVCLDGICYRDLENPENIWMNKRFWEVLGYDINEISNPSELIYSIINKEDLAEATQRFKNHIEESNSPCEQVLKFKHKNGDTVWIRCLGIAVRDKYGKPVKMLGVHKDITDLMIETHQKEKEERKLKAIADNSFDIINILSKEGIIIYESNATERILGYKAGMRVGKSAFDYVHPEDIGYVSKEFQKLISNDNATVVVKFRFKNEQGDWIWFETSGQNLLNDKNINGILINSRDITMQKKAEERINVKQEKIKTLNHYFELFLQQTTDFIYFKDIDSRFIFCSQTLADITGHKHWRDMIGKHDLEVFPVDIAKVFYEEEKPVFNEGKSLLNKINSYYRIDGEKGFVQTNKWPVFDNEKNVVGIFGISRDITEAKKIEEQLIMSKELAEKASKAKSEFLSNMSHEIRTPMNGINGFLELLLYMENDPEKREYLNIIKESSDNLLEIIDNILSISKIEAGKFKIQEKETCLYDKLVSLARLYKRQADLKGLAFNVQIDCSLKKSLVIDEHITLRILNNLLSNAMKYTEKGYIKFSVSKKFGKKIEITVKDTGIGIKNDMLCHLFEPFEQGEHYLTKKYKGTGLGLSIVKKTLDLLNGDIYVNSELGKGTEFMVQIPFRETLINDIKAKEEISKFSIEKKIKIISAEDLEINQILLEKFLKTEDLLLKKVYNGQELLDELETDDYDLILMDIQMPVLNGIEATKIIRKNQKYKDIPIIAVTAYAFEEDFIKMKNAGIDDSVTKPIQKHLLIDKINRMIKVNN